VRGRDDSVAPDRPYYEGQIRDERTVPGRGADFADVALDSRLASTLESEGIERLYDHQAEAVDAVRDGNNVVPRDGDSQREEPGLHRARVRARDGPAGHHPLHRAAGRADQRPDRHALRTGPGAGLRLRRAGRPVHRPTVQVREGGHPGAPADGIADDAGHAPLRHPAPRASPVEVVLRAPGDSRDRRGPRVPRRVREPRLARDAPAEQDGRAVRRRRARGSGREPGVGLLFGDHRESRRARRRGDGPSRAVVPPPRPRFERQRVAPLAAVEPTGVRRRRAGIRGRGRERRRLG